MKTMTGWRWIAKVVAIGVLQLACSFDTGADDGSAGGAGGESGGMGGAGGELSLCEDGDYACELDCAEGDWFCEGRAQQGCAYEDRVWMCVGGHNGDCVWTSACP